MGTIAGTLIIRLKDKKTSSLLILPDSMTKEENIGVVLFVGAGKAKMPPEVEPGDEVVFMHKSHKIRDFILEDEPVKRINFEDVYLINKKDGTKTIKL